MRNLLHLLRCLLIATLALLGAAHGAQARPARPVTILISIDAFRPDYLDLGITPNLSALAREGITAGMRPSFPTVTFSNHYTLVTGLVPDHHGIVNGTFADPAHPGMVFGRASEESWWWDGAEPIWVAAERAGIHSATMFWPGSTTAIHGVRPSDWRPYDASFANRARVDTVLDWLARPAASRPGLVLLYFGDVDIIGHRQGPGSPPVLAAIRDIDAAIGALREGLARLHRPANLVVVSDHGMARVDPARVVWARDYLKQGDYQLVSYGGIYFVNNVAGHEAALAEEMARFPAFIHCWPKGGLPARFHYGSNPRVPDWLCLPDPGARIMDGTPAHPDDRGDHGNDPASPDMRAMFIAAGPAIKVRARMADFDNVDVEPLLRDLLGLPQGAPRDGDDARFRPALMLPPVVASARR